ncbi:MAG: type I-C CRISPR-associated endonuclease Cas1c [Candidatus Accumulibacter sp.]|jgi:CRISPR-associated protein Cas1|nr:type I-C CRISPR-associated endonuclease Cas1c [Accumulibacter sp.]
MELLNTLYVTLPESYLHLDNNTLRLETERETRLRVPLHHLGAIVCFGYVGLSTPLMHRLAEERISLVLLDQHGNFKARLEGALSGNVLLRQAQHVAAGDGAVSLSIARNCVAGKIKNGRHILLRGSREAQEESERYALTRGAQDLAASLRALPIAKDMNVLRGLEGEAARHYFTSLNFLIRPGMREVFHMEGRNRRPPRDRINALLSFVYSLLMSDCRSAVEAVGLDPQIGFLHAIRPGRASLALDIMEEFRVFADRLALSLINRKQIIAKDFVEREGGAVLLADDARRTVLIAYQERKQEKLSHPLLHETIAMGMLPHLQARLLARTLRGDMAEYPPFLMR